MKLNKQIGKNIPLRAVWFEVSPFIQAYILIDQWGAYLQTCGGRSFGKKNPGQSQKYKQFFGSNAYEI